MNPILGRFEIGGEVLLVRAYGTFMILAWVCALVVASLVAHRKGISWRRALAAFAIALAVGVVGARLLDLVVNWSFYAEDTSRILGLNFHGFSLYGGLILAVITGALFARAFRLPLWPTADAAVPALAVGIVFMRTGCFLNGCCYGKVTALPWGVTYPPGSGAWAHQLVERPLNLFGFVVAPVHPTQFYEAAAAVLLAAVGLVWLGALRRDGVSGYRPGVPFLAFALGFTLFRLGNSYLRAPLPGGTAPAWFYPTLYLLLSAGVLALLIWRLRGRGSVIPPAE